MGNALSYLITGTGNACAGQSNVKLSSATPLNDLELSVVGNFGITLPTGSIPMQQKPQFTHHWYEYVNHTIKNENVGVRNKRHNQLWNYLLLGMGNPCAGHNKSIAMPDGCRFSFFTSNDNLGKTLPTGSEYNNVAFCNQARVPNQRFKDWWKDRAMIIFIIYNKLRNLYQKVPAAVYEKQGYPIPTFRYIYFKIWKLMQNKSNLIIPQDINV